MSIEIRQLSIKANVVQRVGENIDTAGGDTLAGHARRGKKLDEEARQEILAECRALVLDLLSRARER
ncbi:MAG TPA: DUF5908 family protein [Trinickia sp.]|jgi:hypothetical protein|uniref:DUF5908 family protein n=1 Tax=Trinickia sp. TaxID=2571163 RepID=UPI002C335470|nr:DUF5908 family protein [Trinickia sp.]HTI18916.1 DUF5908 family protein [Trinickia sp.]